VIVRFGAERAAGLVGGVGESTRSGERRSPGQHGEYLGALVGGERRRGGGGLSLGVAAADRGQRPPLGRPNTVLGEPLGPVPDLWPSGRAARPGSEAAGVGTDDGGLSLLACPSSVVATQQDDYDGHHDEQESGAENGAEDDGEQSRVLVPFWLLRRRVGPDAGTDVCPPTPGGRRSGVTGHADADGVLGGRVEIGESKASRAGRRSDTERRGTTVSAASGEHCIHTDDEASHVISGVRAHRPLQQTRRLRQIVRLTTSTFTHQRTAIGQNLS